MMGELSKLPNIGKSLESKLNQISVNTQEELLALGSREVFSRLKAKDPSACLNELYALEGAIQGLRWHNLSPGTKEDLLTFHKFAK